MDMSGLMGSDILRVMLIEDNDLLGSAVRSGLIQAGYTVDWLRDGETADPLLRHHPPDLLILDLGLPGRDGLHLLRQLRQRDSTIPVVILTARDTIEDRITGLDAGADDYLVKPFDLGELKARLRAITRRRDGRASPVIQHQGIVLNPATREVTHNGELIELSVKATAILEALLERPGHPLSRTQLEDSLYGWDKSVESNAIEVHIHYLRKKLGKNSIRTIRGLGYMIPR